MNDKQQDEIERTVAFMRRLGIRSLSTGDLALELTDPPVPEPVSQARPVPVLSKEEQKAAAEASYRETLFHSVGGS